MRIIILLLVIFLVYIIAKSLLAKKTRGIKKTTNKIQYCRHCNTYITNEDYCLSNNIDYKNCKNYK
jgi:hypothetical protein